MAFTDGQENGLYLSIPITKSTEAEDGTVYVEGLCTDDGIDLDDQIIDRDFAAKGLETWFRDWANVRQQHSSHLAPAGKAVAMEKREDGIWVKTHVVEPTAVKLVKEGVYKAYSVGISRPRIVRDEIAKNGRVIDGIFSEISLVDFPANPRSKFQLAKRAKDGDIELVEKAVEVELTKAAPTPAEVFGNLSKSLKDSAAQLDILRTAAAQADVEKRDMDQNVGGGVDRDKLPDSDFAGPNRSFPIVTPGDVSDAASSLGRAKGDRDAIKANIIRIAHKKGPNFVAQLPDSWKADEKAAGADLTATSEPELTKGSRDCSNCSKSYDADSDAKYCSNCGTKLPAKKGEEPDLTKGAEGAEGAEAEGQEVAPAGEAASESAPAAESAQEATEKPEGSEAPAETSEKTEEPELIKASEIAAIIADAIEKAVAPIKEENERLAKALHDLEASPDPRESAYRGGALTRSATVDKGAAGRVETAAAEVRQLILKARNPQSDIAEAGRDALIKRFGPEVAAGLVTGSYTAEQL